MADRDDALAAYREFTRELIVPLERTQAMAGIEDHRTATRAQIQAPFRPLDRLDGRAELGT